MNYPVWDLTTMGGGLLVALIAVFHVYIAHFAVGGGLFLILSEKKAYKENSPAILEYTKKHAKFFMLLTMVAGGVTGVGIWFIIALLHPSGTSVLIHNFVFGWATEWVCFVGEIVALFIYYYTFGKMESKKHLQIGWLYFIFAWLSLVLITGIINFMLTPGQWLENQSFWSGFFNPSFLPGVVFRTFLAFVFAGVFGLLTASFLHGPKVRETMVRYSARWLTIPFVGLAISAWWYFGSLPETAQQMISGKSPEIVPFMHSFLWLAPILFAGGLLAAVRNLGSLRKLLAFVLLIIGIMYMGSFEWMRESGRRPWIIYDYMYSTSVLKQDVDKINKQGMLHTAKWIKNKNLTDKNILQAGHELFRIQCSACHSVGGPNNDILPLTAKFNVFGMDSMLNGQGKLNTYMPPFMGTKQERMALAKYIVNELHKGKKVQPGQKAKELPYEMPAFDKEQSEYVLLAWNNLGMHCISDSDPWWILLPPANDLFAQLVKRGEMPEIITEGVEINYAVESGFEHPEKQVQFWKYARSLFDLKKDLPAGVGVSGNKVIGTMHLKKDLSAFEASLVPVVPYPTDGSFNPYPLFTITARDKQSGKILAQTKMVAPTSTEMGCKNCHGGDWRVAGVAGFTKETSEDILAVHDRINGTDLLTEARAGKPKLCQSCHADPVLGTKGQPGVLSFPAAIHGWHANYLTERDTTACYKCHPSSATGPTGCLRGVHAGVGLDCTSCHGSLEDHALSLLKYEQKAGKATAESLMRHLKPRTVSTKAAINPRQAWVNEPDCMNCHVDYAQPVSKNINGFNTWTSGGGELFRMRKDEMGLMCEACHGSTHANYPASNIYGKNRDNIPPMQYQGNNLPIGAEKSCYICHTEEMEEDGHHSNFDRKFRNKKLISIKTNN